MNRNERRIGALANRFRATLKRAATIAVSAPGRVNLIGEHTDYNGLPVLPIAIERSIVIAGAARSDRRVQIVNVDPSFPPREYELANEIPAFPAGDWGNYAKAAAQGLHLLLGEKDLRGGDFLVEGNIPAGAGLSSSSALVVASALALLAVNERTADRARLAEVLACAERYVGTLSGGMDQAICLLAEAGRALRIDFAPLRTRLVPVGSGYSFVVCDSLVAAQKSGAARAGYNQRVRECRLASHIISHVLREQLPRPLAQLGDLRDLLPPASLRNLIDSLADVLPSHPVRIDEAARLTGSNPEELSRKLALEPRSDATYAVSPRARHVLGEARRVDEAEDALRNGDWQKFGALMDASHASCRDDYEVSCPELEALVSAAKEAGALGARLTGAGFGGCTVNLVRVGEVESFVAAMQRKYYGGRTNRESCFVFTPCAGASVIQLKRD
jgi:N-acetylgalactosamine kinase